MNRTYYYPSPRHERRTRALTKYTFKMAILTFLTLLFVFQLKTLYLEAYESYGVRDTIIIKHQSLITIISIITIFFLIYDIIKFIIILRTSYQISSNKIIIGKMAILNVHNSERLMKELQKNGNNISDDELIAISKIVSARTVKRFRTRRLPIVDLIFDEMIRIVRGVKLNFDEQFVKTCFKYGIYEKKTYNNPQFFKENKNSIVYICDDSKKLVIPKIYEKMEDSQELKTESYFWVRYLIRLILLFLFSIIIVFVDIKIKSI